MPHLETPVTYDPGIPVDIFTSTAENWGMAMAVRTGHADFNKAVMSRFLELGMAGHASGGMTGKDGQDHHVEVWCEKDAMSRVIDPVCGRFHVRFLANRGCSSSTAMYAAAQRCLEAKDRGQQPVVIYLGGHAPSGVDMSRDVEDRLDLLTRRYGVQVVRLALNYEQVAEYQPPPNSAKLTDSRSPPYVAMYGLESWELDALVSDAIEQFLDQDLYDEILEREEPDQAAIRAAAKSLSSGDGR